MSGFGASLYPLPEKVSGHLAGCELLPARQRARVRRHAEEALRSLNWLHGEGHRRCRRAEPNLATVERVKKLHDETLQMVVGAAQLWSDIDCALTPGESFNELLGSQGGYDANPGSANLAPYEYSRVSMPDDVHDAPYVEDILPAEASYFLKGYEEHMLRSPEEVARIHKEQGEPRSHVDPRLRQHARAYAKLVKRAHHVDLVDFTLDPWCEIGVFFVWKKGKLK